MKKSRATQSPHGGLVTVRPAHDPNESQLVVIVPSCGVPVEAVERALIAFALERANANRTYAARFLSLSRSALLYRMRKHGLSGRPAAASRDAAERRSRV